MHYRIIYLFGYTWVDVLKLMLHTCWSQIKENLNKLVENRTKTDASKPDANTVKMI